VLSHEREKEHHAITHVADFWREEGLEVVFLYGVDRFVPADVAIVHVDLSVVPEEYLDFARQYPVVVNGEVRDIRKATFSTRQVTRDSDYRGQVIVKSNLNHAGRPERRLGIQSGQAVGGFDEPADYRVYESLSDVPMRFFEGDDFIVERFTAQKEDGLYHVQWLNFLGDRHTCKRLKSKNPIVNRPTLVSEEEVEAHPQALELRSKLELDYGKIDYVVRDGAVELLDVNKTPGSAERSSVIDAARRHRAKGIYSYLR
jgi:hypothetical protein